ncbi:MAG: Mce-associated rane protein [Pseudonocardiales bacterium]|nr:Mce-associated rane protein [Pseudonocardiales bacterium]
MSSRRTETTPDAEITSDAETASSTEPAPAAESTPIAADSVAAASTASASTAAGSNGAVSNGAASKGADSDGAGTGAGTAGQAARPRAKQRVAGARKPGAAGTALADRDVEDDTAGTAGTDLIAPTGAGTTSTPGTAREAGTGSAAAEPVDPAGPAAAPAATESGPDLAADRKRVRLLTGLAVAAVVLVAAAVVAAVGWRSAATSGPRSNEAFVDSAATAEVVGQVTNDMTTVYSYDYTNLPANEAAANAVITGKFATEFPRVFGPVKQLAPQEQAVLKSTVPAAGVILLQGDRARLLMMIDQTGTRGAAKEATGATARLVVDAQKVDGRWKISEVTPE